MSALRHKNLIALCLVVLLTAVGCDQATGSGTPANDSSGRVELPPNPDPPKDAKIVATLLGDPDLDGGCVWLRQGATEFAVLWPAGFTADFDPVRLFDAEGTLVAGEGDRLELTGGFAAESADYQPHRCVVGTALWLASTVTVVE